MILPAAAAIHEETVIEQAAAHTIDPNWDSSTKAACYRSVIYPDFDIKRFLPKVVSVNGP
ncbi:hypothetical protein ACTXT7_015872 [Hymenolepis weldensis]